jgi:hypothetical protein
MSSLVAVSLAACECDEDHADVSDAADEADDDDDDDEPAAALLAIDEDLGEVDSLVQIDVRPNHVGEVTVLCDDLALPPELPPDTNFTSLVWRDDRLYASASLATWGDTLVEIDACECSVSLVGSFGYTLVSGLAPGPAARLYGVAADVDMLIEIDPQADGAEPLAPLGGDWGSHGLSGTGPAGALLYALDAESDRLHRFDAADGSPLGDVAVSEDFTAVGLEYHVERELLFACGVGERETDLATIDPDSGLVRIVAEGVFTSACDNLAAGSIACAS